MGILLGILTFVLILVSLFLILVVLAQKSSDGGMGAAFGGGAAEAAFGAETNNVLTKATIYLSVVFFVLAFVLYLGRIYERAHARAADNNALPTIAAPLTPVTLPPTKGTTTTTPTLPNTSAPAVSLPVPATTSTATASPAATPSTPAPVKK